MARARPRTAAVAATLALAAVLAGCSGDDETRLVAPKTSASSQVNMDMPPGYPKADVPVLNGTLLAVTQGTETASSNWRVLLQTTYPPATTVDDASKVLEDAGWKVGKSPSDTARTLTRDAGQRVVLTAREKGGGTELLYVIRLG